MITRISAQLSVRDDTANANRAREALRGHGNTPSLVSGSQLSGGRETWCNRSCTFPRSGVIIGLVSGAVCELDSVAKDTSQTTHRASRISRCSTSTSRTVHGRCRGYCSAPLDPRLRLAALPRSCDRNCKRTGCVRSGFVSPAYVLFFAVASGLICRVRPWCD